MQGVLEKFGTNFIVSAFVPALAFVTLAIILFTPIIPADVVNLITDTFAPLDEPQALLLVLLTTILGFVLHSLNTYIYKVLEGYVILERLPWFRRFQRRKTLPTLRKINLLQRLLDNETLDIDAQTRDKIRDLHFQVSARYHLEYPPSQQLILPTRFGNIFRSIESYSSVRYGMDAVLLWPRMVHAIPPEYFNKIDQSNNKLAFLVNCAILSLFTAVAQLFAAGYQFLMLKAAGNSTIQLPYFIDVQVADMIKYQQRAYIYLAGVVFMTFLFALFYRASLPVINQYGNLVRSSFDLFRFKLLKELNLEMPSEYLDEMELWRDMSHFIGYGETVAEEDLPFVYASNKSSG